MNRFKSLIPCLTAIALPTIVATIIVLHFYLFSIRL